MVRSTSSCGGQHCPLVAILQTTGRATGLAGRAAAVKSHGAQHLSVGGSQGTARTSGAEGMVGEQDAGPGQGAAVRQARVPG